MELIFKKWPESPIIEKPKKFKITRKSVKAQILPKKKDKTAYFLTPSKNCPSIKCRKPIEDVSFSSVSTTPYRGSVTKSCDKLPCNTRIINGKKTFVIRRRSVGHGNIFCAKPVILPAIIKVNVRK